MVDEKAREKFSDSLTRPDKVLLHHNCLKRGIPGSEQVRAEAAAVSGQIRTEQSSPAAQQTATKQSCFWPRERGREAAR